MIINNETLALFHVFHPSGVFHVVAFREACFTKSCMHFMCFVIAVCPVHANLLSRARLLTCMCSYGKYST